LAKESLDLVLMDIKPEGALDDVDAFEIIRNTYDLPLVYITAYADHKLLKKAGITESFRYILKPINPRELNMVIEFALFKHSSEKTLQEKSQKYKATLKQLFLI
jgi:AmiR/NasT family two-component response regulator